MPKHNISPSTRFFPHKERYEIFDGKIVEKFKIFVQDFVPIRTALRDRYIFGTACVLFRGRYKGRLIWLSQMTCS